MTTPILSLVFFAAWAIFLVLTLGSWRVWEVVTGKTKANGFPSGTKHGGDLYWRLNRAHLNAVENLPIFGALVLAGHVVGLTDGTFAQLSVAVAAARVGQTVFHVASNRVISVHLRFVCYLAQIGAMGAMVVSLVGVVG